MKQRKTSTFTIIVILFLYLTPVIVLGQDSEPNNDFENAQVIEVGLTEAFMDSEDRDFFSFQPSNLTDITITIHPSYELTLSTILYDTEQNQLTQRSTDRPGDIMTIHVQDVTSSSYFIEVFSNQVNETGDYTINISEKLVLSVLTIKVIDPSENPIEAALVHSTETPSGQQTLSGQTDENGEVSFNELANGAYTFVIQKTGYLNSTIGQTFGSAGEITLTVTLNENPQVPADSGNWFIQNMFGLGLLAAILILIGLGWWYYTNNRGRLPPITQE